MSRSMSAAGAAIVLAGLVTAAGPAAAAPATTSTAAPTAATAAAACAPGVVTLPALPGGAPWTTGAVNDLGADGLAVGDSVGLPAYWTADHAVHAVPLPDGFQNGKVTAVNAKGLMVGTVERSSDHARAAFTYRDGDAAVRLLTGAATATTHAGDVNDAGRVVGMEAGTAKEWADGTVVRELPVPADAHPSTKIVSVDGINKRGDVLGTAHTEYDDWENDQIVSKTFPVVWPAGGGYPPYSLPVWTETYWTTGTQATGIDDKGRVVGFEQENYRDLRRRTPAVWKKPYDAPPTSPGPVAGYEHLTFDAISPTTNVTVGSAVTFVEGYARYVRAAYWPGTGAPLVLPNPAGASTDVNTEAHAVSDDDRVGGAFRDLATGMNSAVIWTCASKQAYAPQG
ncbi:hypothetical protein J7E97_21670 [Streptomyces sp. ISL-66]|uniref:hypothetical protein n=1 Tax=Streptomyces sp. ISL-66 TaxID=2819186 RepID=UPI001BE53CB2|nr:hypothetical protein [Streptomyces sp. ISL-66]MBT2470409.1 hypothetical protein [Streptomyces sp. ISL-66]